MHRACSIPALLACSIAFGCKPADAVPSDADALALRIRLDASDAKLAALESKLDDAVTKLDDAATRLDAASRAAEETPPGTVGPSAVPTSPADPEEAEIVDLATLFDSFQSDEGTTGPVRCEKRDGARATCTIDRVFMSRLLADPAEFGRQARIVPGTDGGEIRGFKVYGIRPGSLPKLLGLKNGDRLTSVDGRTFAGLDDTMEIMSKALRAESFVIGLERKGVPFALEIVVGER